MYIVRLWAAEEDGRIEKVSLERSEDIDVWEPLKVENGPVDIRAGQKYITVIHTEGPTVSIFPEEQGRRELAMLDAEAQMKGLPGLRWVK